MRKNKMMRTASGLLVATLLTTCVISGTFAKYTSSASGSDSARVAKWSFKVGDTTDIVTSDTFTFDLFNTVNEADGTTKESDVVTAADNATTIIAPGTGGFFDIVLKNESEVTATYQIELKEATNIGNIPVMYSLDGKNWFDLTTTDKTVVYPSTKTDAPETGLQKAKALENTNGTETIKVYWKWDFDNNADTTDTAAGKAQTAGTDQTIKVDAKITATQVD